MTDPADKLRLVSDAVLEDTEQLEAVERDLRQTSIHDRRLEVASETAHAGAELLSEDAAEARRLAAEIAERERHKG